MPASPSTPRLYRIVFVFWESSAFERYSLWNYWVCWDSSRFGILSDRKPLFYIRNSLLFARNHWKPSVKPIISTRCWLLFHRNHICWYVIMYENAGTGYHPVTQNWYATASRFLYMCWFLGFLILRISRKWAVLLADCLSWLARPVGPELAEWMARRTGQLAGQVNPRKLKKQ